MFDDVKHKDLICIRCGYAEANFYKWNITCTYSNISVDMSSTFTLLFEENTNRSRCAYQQIDFKKGVII